VCVCVCACARARCHSESDSSRYSNTALVENWEGEVLLTAELDTKIIVCLTITCGSLSIGFIGLNRPCPFPHPFCVPSEFFKLEWAPLSRKSGKCCLSQALPLWLDNRIQTPLVHTTTEGDPQPNHPTPAICNTVLEKLTFAKLLNMSRNTFRVPTTACHWTVRRLLSHLPYFSIRPSCTPSLSVPCLWVFD
jgi:hypothetical protein